MVNIHGFFCNLLLDLSSSDVISYFIYIYILLNYIPYFGSPITIDIITYYFGICLHGAWQYRINIRVFVCVRAWFCIVVYNLITYLTLQFREK